MTWLKGEKESKSFRLVFVSKSQHAEHTAVTKLRVATALKGHSVRVHVGFPVEEIVRQGGGGGRGGDCGSELMQMGGADSSRGITSKALGAEEQT